MKGGVASGWVFRHFHQMQCNGLQSATSEITDNNSNSDGLPWFSYKRLTPSAVLVSSTCSGSRAQTGTFPASLCPQLDVWSVTVSWAVEPVLCYNIINSYSGQWLRAFEIMTSKQLLITITSDWPFCETGEELTALFPLLCCWAVKPSLTMPSNEFALGFINDLEINIKVSVKFPASFDLNLIFLTTESSSTDQRSAFHCCA